MPAGQAIADGNMFKPDALESGFALYLGGFPGHSGKPMQVIARQAAVESCDGKLKFVVVDPVMAGGAISPTGDKGKWVPIKPSTDGAFIMAMLQWIFKNERYNEEFLSSPSLEAARKKGYNSWTNACHLVIADEKHPNYRKMLRPADLGIDLGNKEDDALEDVFVVIDKKTKKPVPHTDTDDAQLIFNGTVKTEDGKTIKVRTSMDILIESANEHDMETYSKACGVPVDTIEEIAKEFTAHGYKVGTDGMGGTATSNGSDLTFGMYILPALMGAYNKKGGATTRRITYARFSPGPRYNLAKIEGAPEKKGQVISRTGVRYEDTAEYKKKVANGEDPYPSKLPWFPIGSASDNQAVFSIIHQYPYKAKIMVNWMFNPLLSSPSTAREEIINGLCDVNNLPLLISIDAFMGETTALADYVIPDTTQYENWGNGHGEGQIPIKYNKVRWPVVEPMTMKLSDGRYACFENYLIDVAKKIGVPGFGDKAVKDNEGNFHAINCPEDYFLKAIANTAFDEEPVPDISDHEADLIGLKPHMEEWKSSIKEEEIKKVAYVVSRGGRFESLSEAYTGEDGTDTKYAHEGLIKFYMENVATSRNSFTGEYFSGVPGWNPEAFADGTLLTEKYPESEWPFRGANYKPKFRSVTMLANTRLRDLCKTNYVEVNTEDAEKLGLKTGDTVKIISPTGGELTGILLARQGIAKGTIGVAFGYGHWEYGARKHQLGEEEIGGVKSIGDGVNLTEISMLDTTFSEIFALSDMITGAPSRNGGLYRIEKA